MAINLNNCSVRLKKLLSLADVQAINIQTNGQSYRWQAMEAPWPRGHKVPRCDGYWRLSSWVQYGKLVDDGQTGVGKQKVLPQKRSTDK